MRLKSLRTVTGRALAILALAASLLTIGVLSVSADGSGQTEPDFASLSEPEPMVLTIEGVAARSVDYDGAVARFRVSLVRDSALEARQAGALVVDAIDDAVAQNCTPGEPENADHTAPPTCISPDGLQTVGFRLGQQWDWTEEGRVLVGWEYEYSLQIAIRGTGFSGGLVDLLIVAGGDSLHFDGLDFTASRRAEAERLALLDAIDDAQATADSIADHMGYEIARIVELTPIGAPSAYPVAEARALAADEADFAPTPVAAGSDTVTERVRMVFELRPLPESEE